MKGFGNIGRKERQPVTSATRQVRQRWFSVGIFPPGLVFGLTGNRPQSAPAYSSVRYRAFKKTPFDMCDDNSNNINKNQNL